MIWTRPLVAVLLVGCAAETRAALDEAPSEKVDASAPSAPLAAPTERVGPLAASLEGGATGLSAKSAERLGLFLGPDAEHACIVALDRTVRCWGRNDASQAGEGLRDREQPTRVEGVTDASTLALGARHTCAARRDGDVICWGDGTLGQLGATAPLERVQGIADVVELVAGEHHTCAREREGRVSCWGTMGDRRIERVEVPGLVATHLASAGGAACALTPESKVMCWGSNASGAVIVGGAAYLDVPTEAPKIVGAPIGLAMADRSTCVFDAEGKQCWGIGAMGEARVEPRWGYFKPTRLAMGGDRGQLAIDASGRIDDEQTVGHLAYDQRAREVHLGRGFGCLVDLEGDTRCWGRNDRRQLARGGGTAQPTPTKMRGVPRLASIALAEGMSCGRTPEGEVSCFGGDVEAPASRPVTWSAMASVDALVSGGGVVCALARGIPTCWGRNRPRVLPSVNAAMIASPLTLGSLANKGALAFGARAGCTVDGANELRCFGGGGERPAPPTLVPLDGPIATGQRGALSLGLRRGCVVHADAGVSCFDLTPRFDRARGFSFSSRRVPGVRGWTNLEVGGALACGFDRGGALTCFDERDREVEIEGTQDLVDIAVGDTSACGRTRDGRVKCWGDNTHGEVGRGSFEPTTSARVVPGLADVVAIDTAGRHYCALTRAGEMWCWGADNAGQSGGETEMMFDAPVPLYL